MQTFTVIKHLDPLEDRVARLPYADAAGVEVKLSLLSGYFATAGYQAELCKTGFPCSHTALSALLNTQRRVHPALSPGILASIRNNSDTLRPKATVWLNQNKRSCRSSQACGY